MCSSLRFQSEGGCTRDVRAVRRRAAHAGARIMRAGGGRGVCGAFHLRGVPIMRGGRGDARGRGGEGARGGEGKTQASKRIPSDSHPAGLAHNPADGCRSESGWAQEGGWFTSDAWGRAGRGGDGGRGGRAIPTAVSSSEDRLRLWAVKGGEVVHGEFLRPYRVTA